MLDSNDVLTKVQVLKNLLVARATGQLIDEEEFSTLRNQLIIIPSVKNKLPRFLSSCRTVREFWAFIQPEFPHYQQRREYLQQEFEPLLSMLESESQTPGDAVTSEAIEIVDSAHVTAMWAKCLERRDTDPEGAITAARTLLETVCKHILDEAGITYPDNCDLPKLHWLVSEKLQLAPGQHTETEVKKILGGCFAIVDGLASIRNRLSDAHGKSKNAVQPDQRHAELAVNLAGSVATFLLETWEANKPQSIFKPAWS